MNFQNVYIGARPIVKVYQGGEVVFGAATPDKSQLVTDGLVGYWNSKQGVNGNVWENIAPDASSVSNGQITGATLTGNGMYFDGVDDSIFIPNLEMNNDLNEWTYQAIVTISSYKLMSILYNTNELNQTGNELGVNAMGKANTIARWQSGTSFTVASNAILPMDTPVMITFMYSGSKLFIYINNSLDRSSNFTSIAFRRSSFLIGRSTVTTRFFVGSIHSVRIYNRVLTPEEISQNYSVGLEVGLVDTTPPSDVTNLTETNTESSVSLNWVNPMDLDFSHVRIYRDNVLIEDNHLLETYTDSGLLSNTVYEYRMTTVDTSDNESVGVSITVKTSAVIHPEPIITDGLVGYWNSNYGVVGNVWQNIAPDASSLSNGEIRGATLTKDGMYFDGVDDEIFVPELEMNNDLNEFTYQAIITMSSFKAAMGILYNTNKLNQAGNELSLTAAGKVNTVMRFQDNSPFPSTRVTSAVLPMNKPVMITFTYSGSDNLVTVYIDEFRIPSNQTAGITLRLPSFMIGRTTQIDRFFEGLIHSVKIYNRALTPEEISRNYEVGREVGLPPPKVVTDGLVGYWNSKQGVNGNVWENIAPTTKGKYNGVISGATVAQDGMYFDGVDDFVEIITPNEIVKVTDLTIEFRIKLESPIQEPVYISRSKNAGDSIVGVYFQNTSFFRREIVDFTPSRVSTNETYLTVVYNSSDHTVLFYYNGVPTRLATAPSKVGVQIFLETFFLSGTGQTDAFRVKGFLDGVRTYSRMLTPQEISQNYAVRREVGL